MTDAEAVAIIYSERHRPVSMTDADYEAARAEARRLWELKEAADKAWWAVERPTSAGRR